MSFKEHKIYEDLEIRITTSTEFAQQLRDFNHLARGLWWDTVLEADAEYTRQLNAWAHAEAEKAGQNPGQYDERYVHPDVT
jgi:hypothetical protein